MMLSDPDICVCKPITDNFTTFEILIQTSNPAFTLRQSRTRRRYNDFCWLRKILKKHHPLIGCPELPEKKKFSERFEIQFLVQRMKELEDWLQSIVAVSLYLSDTTLHLFLQTSLTCEQIVQYVNGKLPETEVQQGYKEAELHLDENISSFELSLRDYGGGAAGLSSSVCPEASQSSPVAIQYQPQPALHNTQEHADSGIAEFDSDAESSYDSQGSPYVRSLDSGMIPEKYPPLTEVSQVSRNKNSNNDSPVNLESDKMSRRKHSSGGTDKMLAFRVETVFSKDVYNTDVEVKVTSEERVNVSDTERTQESNSTLTAEDVNSEAVSERSVNADDQEKSPGKVETGAKQSETGPKVQMGVLFC